jgi:MerR family transcriptional regulator, thiopeptide resistance regulator
MNVSTKELYRPKEFASLAGVTVRALHHYDRLGLLRPKQRSRAGYRLYTAQDFGRLEQIVVLKFLGLPLKQIRGLLQSGSNLAAVLQHQQEVLLERRLQLDRAIRAIANAQKSVQSRKEPDWQLFQYIVKEIEMQKSIEWKGKYFSAEAKARVAARRSQLSPEFQEKANKDWENLYADVAASLGEDPAGPKGQALADRWRKLVHDFTGGDPEILKGLQAMMKDKANWPEGAQKGNFAKPELQAFLAKALAHTPHEQLT